MNLDITWPFAMLYMFMIFICIFSIKNQNGVVNVVISLFLIVIVSYFSGFKTSGLDLENYILYFERTPDFLSVIKGEEPFIFVEPGYIYLNSIFKVLSNNFYYFSFFISLLSISLIFIGYKKVSENYVIISLLYLSSSFYSMYYTQLRNGLACSIIILAINYFTRERFIRFYTITLSAIFIHTSAIFMLAIGLHRFIKPTYRILLIAIVLSVLFTIVDTFKLTLNVMSWLPLPEFIVNKINLYVSSGRDNIKQGFFSITNVISIITLFWYVYSVGNRQQSKLLSISFFFVLFSFLLNNFFSFYGEVAARFYRVGFIFIPILWMACYEKIRMNNLIYNIPFLIVACFLFIYYGHFNKIVPAYHNYFYLWFGL